MLYGLILIPVILVLYFLWLRWRKKAIEQFGDRNIVYQLFIDYSKTRQRIKFIIFLIAYFFLIIGIADPQIGSKLETVKKKGIDLMIALDVSNSMMCEDVAPNRLERAKQAISRIIDNMNNDRIGIIVFAGQAYTQLPITTDYYAAKMFLENISTDMVPTQGTAIGAAIRLATESFGNEKGKNRAIVVITDGENHEDDAISEAKNALEQGIIVYTIGIGQPTGGPIPIYANGKMIGYKKDKDGNTVITKLDETMLQQIAANSNGAFFRITNSNAGLNSLLEKLDKMDKKEIGTKVFTDYEDRFPLFIGICLFLIIFELLIFEKKNNLFSHFKQIFNQLQNIKHS
jgi:Ca-activated chloride channel family protein